VFAAALVWTVRLDSARVLRLARLPLDEAAGEQSDDRSAARRVA